MPTSRLRPKRWEVIKRTMRPEKGVKVGNKFYKYGTSGSFTVNDPGVAREMEKYHAADVLVAEVDKPKPMGEVSNNTFAQMPAMPWHKDRKFFWERKTRKGNTDAGKKETPKQQRTQGKTGSEETKAGQ